MLTFIGCSSDKDSVKKDDDTKSRLDYKRESSLGVNDSKTDSIQDLKGIDKDILDTAMIREFIKSAKIKSLPYYDSTNFDNFLEGGIITDDLFSALNLDTIMPFNLKNLDKVWLQGRLDISGDFYAITVGFMPNENELFKTLITYDNQFNMISFKYIAYDDIAESCHRVESYIDTDFIKIIDTEFCFRMSTDTLKFLMLKDGEILPTTNKM